MGLFDPHAGSWGGLPDFSITENIGNLLGAGRTAQGGSNLTGAVGNYPTAITNNGQQIQGPGLGWYGDVGTKNGQIWQDPSRPISGNNGTSGGSLGPSGTLGASTGPANPNGSKIQSAKDSNPAFQNMSDQAILDALNGQNNLRNEISSGWDNYIGSLNDMANNGLGQQRSAQENIANSQYDQGVNAVNSQKSKSLRDIANNTANAFQAGNIYLGSQGAGDSSAANQYSYALNKQAGKQTGNLNEFVNTQIQNLGSQRDQQVNQIASWFADAQNQLKQAIASGQLNKSQDLANLSKDLLNRSLSQLDQINQQHQQRYDALLGWAASNSHNIGQLQQNIAGIPQAMGTPQISSSGNYMVPTGYGSSNNDQNQNNQLQNPSWFS